MLRGLAMWPGRAVAVWLLLLVAVLPAALGLKVRQPNTLVKDIYPVQIFGNDKFVDRNKYLKMVQALMGIALGKKGLTTGVDFATMVKFDYTKFMASRVFFMPSLEFDDMLNLDPKVNNSMRSYVESGHMLVVTMADPEGMDYPVTFLNTVFGLNLTGAAVSPGSDCERNETDGFAWPFEKAPAKLPYVDKLFGVTTESLPQSAYRVYAEGNTVPVFMVPYGSGLVVGYGLDYDEDESPQFQEWRDVLRLIIDEGRFLDKIRLGMSVVRHQGSKFGVVEARGNWSGDGREDIDNQGLTCKAWRKTLNCDPSGPRDFHGDKNCSAIVPQGESGFCECDGYVQTAAAPCNHRLINCEQECKKINRRYKDIYGDDYKAPGLHEMMDAVNKAVAYHHANMMNKSDVAVASVDNMVKAAKQAKDQLDDKMKKFKDEPVWKQLAEAGRNAESAGKHVGDMASLADPFLPDSKWTFPNPNYDNAPPPPWSRYMASNPIFQDWLKKNMYDLQRTPAPEPSFLDEEPE